MKTETILLIVILINLVVSNIAQRDRDNRIIKIIEAKNDTINKRN